MKLSLAILFVVCLAVNVTSFTLRNDERGTVERGVTIEEKRETPRHDIPMNFKVPSSTIELSAFKRTVDDMKRGLDKLTRAVTIDEKRGTGSFERETTVDEKRGTESVDSVEPINQKRGTGSFERETTVGEKRGTESVDSVEPINQKRETGSIGEKRGTGSFGEKRGTESIDSVEPINQKRSTGSFERETTVDEKRETAPFTSKIARSNTIELSAIKRTVDDMKRGLDKLTRAVTIGEKRGTESVDSVESINQKRETGSIDEKRGTGSFGEKRGTDSFERAVPFTSKITRSNTIELSAFKRTVDDMKRGLDKLTRAVIVDGKQ